MGRCADGVEGSGVWWRGWAPTQKTIIFCPQNDKFWCILPQFLTGRKHRSLETRILQFNREITKLTKQCKNYPKIHGQKTRKGGSTIPPEYATARANIG